jgi:tetratricopeptide (TPR) repeat protein
MIQQKLAAAYPNVPAYQNDLALTYNNRANLHQNLGHPRKARQSYQEAITIASKLVGTQPKVPAYQASLATTYANLANLEKNLGRPDAASKAYQAAGALYARLAAAHPEVPAHQNGLARTHHHVGVLEAERDRWQAARKSFDQAIARAQAVLRREQRQSEAWGILRVTYQARAEALGHLGRHTEAVADWDRAIATAPEQQQVDCRLHRCYALAAAGHYARALAEVNELAQIRSTDGEFRYNLACVCSRAAAAARKDVQLTPGQRDKQAEELARRALAFLNEAKAAHFFRARDAVEDLRTNQAFELLRQRAEFRKLLAEVNTSPRPKH